MSRLKVKLWLVMEKFGDFIDFCLSFLIAGCIDEVVKLMREMADKNIFIEITSLVQWKLHQLAGRAEFIGHLLVVAKCIQTP